MEILDIQTMLGHAIWLACLFSAALLIPSFILGLLVGVFQAITSIQDQILSFAPKVVIVGLILFLCSGWMLGELRLYTEDIFQASARVGHSG